MNQENRYDENRLLGRVSESDAQGEGFYKDSTEEAENENKTVLDGVPRSRGWSVAAMVLGLFSVLLSLIPLFGTLRGVFGPFLGVMAVIASLVSRRNLGYFDGVGIAGIILGAVGCAFGVTVLLFALFFG